MREFCKISPRFFTGKVGIEIRGDADAYAVAFYVMCGPHVNSIGLYRLPVGTLADELGIPRPRVEQGLQRLLDAGLVKYDERTMHIWIVDYMRHQWSGLAPNQRKGIESELEQHKVSSVFNDFLAMYGEEYGLEINHCPTLGQPLTDSLPIPETRDQRPETRDQRESETSSPHPARAGKAASADTVFDGHDIGVEALRQHQGKPFRAHARSGKSQPVRKRRKDVLAAIDTHGEELCRLAARNLVLSPHHRGDTDSNTTEYLEICYAMRKVEYYAGLCALPDDEFRRQLPSLIAKQSRSNGTNGGSPEHDNPGWSAERAAQIRELGRKAEEISRQSMGMH